MNPTMNQHLYFDDRGDQMAAPPATPVKVQVCAHPVVTPGSSTSDDDGSYKDDGVSSSSSDDEFDTSSEEDVQTTSIRTHVPSSNDFRSDVDMSLFGSLQEHLSVLLEMKPRAIKTLHGRVAEYLGWVMNKRGLTQQAAAEFLLANATLLLQYVTVLKGHFHLKNGTIYNTLLDLSIWAKYLSIYENKNIVQFVGVLEAQQKIEAKKKRSDISSRLSRENLLKQRQWPVGGQQELSNLLQQHKPRVDRIINRCMDGKLVDDSDLTFANDWVVSHLFVQNPQGRSQAITLLPVSQLERLSCGNTTSTAFKTRATYGSQSINCSPASYRYLAAYVHYIRPYWLCAASKEEPALFINRHGTQHKDIGVCVTRFFHCVSNYHITTTTLRALFETEVHDAMEAGTLTTNECDDVIRNSGHSSATAHTHYLKRKAGAVGHNAMAVHAKLYGRPAVSTPPRAAVDDEWYGDMQAADDDAHDDDLVPPPTRRRRVDWSVAELHHLTTWVQAFEAANGPSATKSWRACVAAMQLTGVCHELHLTTTSLREAWRREKKRLRATLP